METITSLLQGELDRALLDAAQARDLRAAERLLARGARPETRFGEKTALAAAMDNNDAAMMRLLAPRARYIDSTDSCDFSLFTYAARRNLPDIAHALLDSGASPFPPGPGAEFPLDWAIAHKMYDVVGRMLKAGGFPDRAYRGEPLLVYAARYNDLCLAATCLDSGANIDHGEAKHGYTALHVAARNGLADFMSLLIDRGARTDVKANGSQTPFDWAGKHERALRAIVARREMREASRVITQGIPEAITVAGPMRLRKRNSLQR